MSPTAHLSQHPQTINVFVCFYFTDINIPAKEDNIYRAVKIFETGFALHMCHFYFFIFFSFL